MSECIPIYVQKKKLLFSNKQSDREVIRAILYPDGFPSEQQKEEIKAVQLAGCLVTVQRHLLQMFGDIQHRLFRLGKLSGLKGDAYQAYADQIGDNIRIARHRLIVGVLSQNILLFREDDLANGANLVQPLDLDAEKYAGLRWIDPEVFIDWDGSIKGEGKGHSLFPQYEPPEKEGKICYAWLHSLDEFFHPLLAAAGDGSLYDRLIEIAKLAFSDGEDPFHRYAEPRKAEIFVKKAAEIVFEGIGGIVSMWARAGLIVPCTHGEDPQCGDHGDHRLFIDEFLFRRRIDGSVCPYCNGFGMKFTDKVRTTKLKQGAGTALPTSIPIAFGDERSSL